MEPTKYLACLPSFWEKLTAIGTLLAALVAVIIAVFGEKMRSRFIYPNLKISTNFQYNYESNTSSDNNQKISSAELIIQIENVGNARAKGCFLTIKDIQIQNKNQQGYQPDFQLGSGKRLSPGHNAYYKKGKCIDIDREDCVDMIFGVINKPPSLNNIDETDVPQNKIPVLSIVVKDKDNKPIILKKNRTYKCVVHIQGDNFKIIKQAIKIKWEGNTLEDSKSATTFLLDKTLPGSIS